jgi:uncharacterized membrane protein (UPF0127 family)
MRTNASAKTASARKNRKPTYVIATVAGAVLLCIGISLRVSAGRNPACAESYRHDAELSIRNRTLQTQVSDDEAERIQGLSGKACLPQDYAMLFVFDKPGANYCFWMKDMKFPIDIVWLDHDKNVVHLAQNTYPSSYPKTFCPDAATQYVIELPRGDAQRLEIAEGDRFSF